uniref:Uncharacterized protein n=1 Tax=Siphoviridae sp. ct4be24 TaxID=2826289 RepID=A0A8S5QRS5_9CAUD|nr:MAG TPA: hypothetical protein [Siphoviridae sp. ct4be24]
MICRDCYIPMSIVFSFSSDKHEKFCRYPKCCSETRHMKINDNELSFGEILHREIKKGK